MDPRDVQSDQIRDWLLEVLDGDDLNDATSEEEDCVEEDDIQPTDDDDDSDKDPDWDPDPVGTNLERILHKRQKRSFVEFCDDDYLCDSSLETSQVMDRPLSAEYDTLDQNEAREPAHLTDTCETTMPSTSNADGGNVSSHDNGLSCSHGRFPLRTVNSRGRPRSRGSQLRVRGNRRGEEEVTQTEDLTLLLPSNANPLILLPNKAVIRGKDLTPWSTKNPTGRNVPRRNILHVRRGPKNNARNARTPRECFDLFFTEEMKDKIVLHTNEQIQRVRNNYRQEKNTTADVSIEELDAFFGVLLFTAIMKNNHLPTRCIFNEQMCGSRYRAVMSRERFEFLLLCLRFDDKETREDRSKEDPLAPIRGLWDLFNKNCSDNYNPSGYVTIDEQLLAFRGKCRFRMYIPNKPSKYGLKIVMACDTSTSYMFNAIPYVGKRTYSGQLPLAEYLVKEITKPIHGTNRNVTCDNWFTSVKLVHDLLQPPYDLTYVGTVRSNKREIPSELKKSTKRPVGTSVFCFDNEKTLVSFKPKQNKNVILISSMHYSSELHHETKKPWIIHSYNSTKGAVDTLDQMCQNVSCSRKTRRWPLCFFYGMQNITYVNAFVIYCLNAERRSEKPMNRREFGVQLCDELTFPHMRKRLQAPSLQRKLRAIIQENLGIQEADGPGRQTPGPRKTCVYCPSKKRRMTTSYCNHCRQPICAEHRAVCCLRCDEEK